ncbi:hypothetical protein BKI52_24675 [marine bacterium AO1-C]|nr:hypothetical protein BKI52_24675 [marine bacterium AO1-C]
MKGHPFVYVCHLLVWLLGLPHISLSQQTDSTLLAQLKTATQDSTRIRIYNQLALNNQYSNINLVKQYSFAALELIDTNRVSMQLGNTYLNLLLYYQTSGDYTKAAIYSDKALDIYKKTNDSLGICRIYNSLGTIAEERGEYVQAIDDHFKSLAIAQKLKLSSRISSNLNNIASVYMSIGQLDKAVEYFKRSLDIEIKEKDVKGISIAQVNIAEIYLLKKNYNKALQYATQSLENARKAKVVLVEAVALKFMAMVQAVKKDTANALANFAKSDQTFIRNDFPLEHVRLKVEISKYYLSLNDLAKSEQYANAALDEVQTINTKKELKNVYKLLSDLYEAKGQITKAFEYHKTYSNYKDSLSQENARNQLIQKELKRKYDQQQSQQITAITKEINQRDYYLYAISIGLLLVSVFTFFLYRSTQKQKKLNLELKTQKGVFKAVNQHLQEKQAEIETNNQELKFLNHRLKSGESVITKAYDQLQNRNKQLKNNIRAALTIQQAILPTPQLLKELLPEHFIIYLPKDIVSGDFYWASEVEGKKVVIFADCTGHGVQGAFMSLIGHNLLDKIILQQKNTDPASILTQLNEQVSVALHQQEVRSIEGMDIGVVIMEPAIDGQVHLTYAGAKRPLYYISVDNPKEICMVKGVRKSIGGLQQRNKAFKNNQITLPTGSLWYGGTDGLTDQHDFNRTKLGSLRLQEILLEIYQLPIEEQETSLFAIIQSHMINTEQRDDMLWMGVKV